MTSTNACDAILGEGMRRAGREAVALIHADGAMTYGELDAHVGRFGNALLRAGVGRGERVLLLLEDGPDLVAAWLAAVRVGAVAVALNLRSAPRDLAFALDDSRCAAIIVGAAFVPVWEESRALAAHRPPVVVRVGGAAGDDGMRPLDDFLAGAGDTVPAAAVEADEAAFWIYSSGTTGTPKAAVHRHGSVLLGDLHLGRNLGLAPGERMLCTSKLFFAYALGHALIGGLRSGATIILHDAWPEPRGIVELVARHRPHLFLSVPSLYHAILRDGLAAGEGFASVRHFVSAGEKLPEIVLRRWLEATGKPILEGIGASETLFLFIAGTPDAWRAGATGRPLPWVEARLIDAADRPVTAAGEAGVLWVRMASVASGYWNQPERTAAAFRDGWYRTGDMFAVDAEGWWHHQGRADDMLKISGQWVSPAEIEEVALTVPGVADAAAVGVPNDAGLVRLALFAVPAAGGGGGEALAERIRETLTGRLSVYKCPRTIRFVEDLPRTATGKVQRYKLRQMIDG